MAGEDLARALTGGLIGYGIEERFTATNPTNSIDQTPSHLLGILTTSQVKLLEMLCWQFGQRVGRACRLCPTSPRLNVGQQKAVARPTELLLPTNYTLTCCHD
jgi:hypothetical protein